MLKKIKFRRCKIVADKGYPNYNFIEESKIKQNNFISPPKNYGGKCRHNNLRRERNVKEGREDFTVESTKKFVESFLVIFNVITTLLIGLASISLLVGAIGIANTMYTAVLERRREIGIMKSIGAKNSDIIQIFLIESSLIGFIGGTIGVLIGSGLSLLAEKLIETFLGEGFFQVFLPWWLLLGAALFALVIGTISGIFPARQATGMNPVDALRS